MKIQYNAKSLEEWNNIFQSFNSNISIVKELNKEKGKRRRMLCHCSICNQNFERCANKFKQHCPICSGKKVVVGINDMATVAPWMIKYLKNTDDGFKYTKSCSHRIIFKCPYCGYEKESKINNIYNFGFSCDICGDGISRANKFARAFLKQLQLENLHFEYSDVWTNNKIYDAYFEYNNKKYVLEIDGEQHRKDTEWSTLSFQMENDYIKDLLAIKNNVEIIRIPYEYLQYENLINSFKNSKLNEIEGFDKVDWFKCIENADRNYMIEVCNYYNNITKNIKQISENFKISQTTTREYLNNGNKLGICEYANIIYENGVKRKRNWKDDVLKDSLFYKICEYGTKNKDATYSDFLAIFKIPKGKLKKYLEFGREHGYTEHSYSLMRKKISKNANEKQKEKMPISLEVYDNNNELIGQYTSQIKCIDALNNIYPDKHYERHKLGSLLQENKEIIYKGLKFVSLKKKKGTNINECK